jgi:arylsulfatase A-like enzyme
MQVDAAVGQILASLESNGLADLTVVIFTSDNGCSPVAKYPELLAIGMQPVDVCFPAFPAHTWGSLRGAIFARRFGRRPLAPHVLMAGEVFDIP